MIGPETQLESEDFDYSYNCGHTTAFIFDVVKVEVMSPQGGGFPYHQTCSKNHGGAMQDL
eukprot:3847324-Prorocentrum_lima.AAC.1